MAARIPSDVHWLVVEPRKAPTVLNSVHRFSIFKSNPGPQWKPLCRMHTRTSGPNDWCCLTQGHLEFSAASAGSW
eukprot:362139-Rhodomonas_salina.1